MKKRILSLLLVAAMLFGMIPAALAQESGFAPQERMQLGTSGENKAYGPMELAVDSGFGLSEARKTEDPSAQPAPAEADTGLLELGDRKPFSQSEAGAQFAAKDLVTFIVVTGDEALLDEFSAEEIAAETQQVSKAKGQKKEKLKNVRNSLNKAFGKEKNFKLGYDYTVATTGVSVTTEYGNKAAIEALPGVAYVYVAPTFALPPEMELGDVAPMTGNATGMIGAGMLNTSGYTGKGMRIAILDTGLSVNNPSFLPLSADQLTEASLTKEEVAGVWNELNASKTSELNRAYLSTKIPYAFNYYGMNYDVSHATAGSDHGTHVAGIAAANKLSSTTAVGVAPEAQLLVMQVFGRQGADWSVIMAALEDCVRLNVDAVNLSLGSAAGFTDRAGEAMVEILDRFKATDIQVVIAAGNDTNNAYQNLTGLNLSKTGNPDTGLVGTPSTFSAALSVASVDNDGAEQLYFTVNGKVIGYTDTAADPATRFLDNFQDKTLEFVPVGGIGAEEDYGNVDVAGKVALVSRGGNSFPEKQAIAQAHGAIACVVYNNAPGMLRMQINDGAGNIPCVSTTMSYGKYMVEQYQTGVTTMTVCGGDLAHINMDRNMSDFSSWGVTPDLQLKPEISGVGGNIYSTRDPAISGSNYGLMGGTSMASPQIAGAMAVLTQYLRENSDYQEDELRRVAADLMLSTCNPVMRGETEYSPRVQGAGLADLVKATTTKAYLTNPDVSEGRPKGEMGDDAGRTGVYTFPFAITNISDEPLTYTFDYSLFTESVAYDRYIAGVPYGLSGNVTVSASGDAGFTAALKYDFNGDGTITEADAEVLLAHVSGKAPIPETDPHYAYRNVNGDKKVDRKDVQVLTDFCSGKKVKVDVLALIPMEGAALKYDFNGDGAITEADADVLLAHISGKTLLPETDPRYAYLDVSGDGKTDKKDAKVITDFCAGKKVKVDVLAVFYADAGAPAASVTVAPGQTLALTATVTLSAEDKAYMDANFENGIFVEGFLYARTADEGNVDMNMPFVGFYGDWSDAPVFDDAEDPSLYGATIYTTKSTELGKNPYIRTGKGGGDYNAVSYAAPLAELDFGMLRNAKRLNFIVTDRDTQEEYFRLGGDDIRKSYFNGNYGMVFPFYIFNENETENAVWRGTDKDGNQLPNNTRVTYTVEAYVDDGDDQVDDIWSFDLTLDTEKPKIVNALTLQEDLVVDAEHGTVKLPLTLLDNQHIAALIFVSPEGVVMGKYEVENTPGETITVEYDISGFGTDFTIVLADYALNETEMDVSLNLGSMSGQKPTVKKLDTGRIYGCEAFSRAAVEPGWFSTDKGYTDYRNETFDSASIYYSAEYVNGYVVAQRADNGDIVLLTPYSTYWGSQQLLHQDGAVGTPGFKVLYDMALDYSDKGADFEKNNTLYAVGWNYAGDTTGDGRDDGYNALFEIEIYKNGYISLDEKAAISGTQDGGEILTLGCTTSGQLYGIDTAGKLYSMERDGACTYIGTTDFVNMMNYSGVNVIQSMGYDHNTGTMYWFAHSQTEIGGRYENVCMTYEVNLETAKCTAVGTYGPGGPTSLFVPTDRVSDLFTMGVKPESFSLSPYKTTMALTQVKRLDVKWSPWNASPVDMTWESSDPAVATVNEAGFVTAVSQGEAEISATAQVWDPWSGWDDATGTYAGAWVERTSTCSVRVVPSADGIYSYIVMDWNNADNNFSWVTYPDTNPAAVTQLNKPMVDGTDMDGNSAKIPPMYQGGAYYQGYVYTVFKEAKNIDGVMYAGTSLYKTQVTEGATPAETVFGEPEFVGLTTNIELGNLGFDYNTGRMYAVDYTNGGLAIVDLDTGAIDLLGTFSGDIGGPAIATSMCVTRAGQILICDMEGELYLVDCDTLDTTRVGSLGQQAWYYAAMTYDYNTDNIYWNPCNSAERSSLYMVHLVEDEWDPQRLNAEVVKLGNVSSKAGVEQCVMFTIPENEPETKQIPVESIEITNGDSAIGLVGGTLQLETVTTPARPTVRTRSWSSSDDSVVTIDHFGKMTFQGVGEADVTVTIANKNPADGGPFMDTIHVSVLEAAGELQAYLAYDQSGTQYSDWWITVHDNNIRRSDVLERAGSYILYTGEYYDGYYYAYNNEGKFYRIDADDRSYKELGSSKTGSDLSLPLVAGMAFDYTRGVMYGVTASTSADGLGYLVTIDLDSGALTPVAQLDQEVFALAVDKDGVLYGAGSSSWGVDASMYTIDPETAACTEFMTIPDVWVGVDGNDYNNLFYLPQMTYDHTTNRLYLHASYKGAFWEESFGMYMFSLEGGPEKAQMVYLGMPGLNTRTEEPKKGNQMYLGMLCAVPAEDEIPVGAVNGIYLNREHARISVGGTTEITAQVRPTNAVNQNVTWTTSDANVATVENGVITGVAAGTATITVTSQENPDAKAECVVTVVALGDKHSVGYTISASQEGLVRFNPELPSETAEVIATIGGGRTIVGMDDAEGGLYYLVEEYPGATPLLYWYDMTTKQSTLKGMLYVMIGDISDMAYDEVNNLLYVVSGFYVFQYDMSRMAPDGTTDPSGKIDITVTDWSYPTMQAVTCVDGEVYFFAKSNYYDAGKLYHTDKDLNGSTMTVDLELTLPVTAGEVEMDYDSASGLFYITDAANNLYTFDMDGNVTLVDILGSGWDFNGLAIQSAG